MTEEAFKLLQAHLVHRIGEPAGQSLEISSLRRREVAKPLNTRPTIFAAASRGFCYLPDTVAHICRTRETDVLQATFRLANADHTASKEKQVSESVIPIIEGMIVDGRCRPGGIPFTNLDPLTDGTPRSGNPDIYSTRQVSSFTMQHGLPMIAPNFFLAAKGPYGSTAVAKRQAYYDGAFGTRGSTACSHTDRANQLITTIYLPLCRFVTMTSSNVYKPSCATKVPWKPS